MTVKSRTINGENVCLFINSYSIKHLHCTTGESTIIIYRHRSTEVHRPFRKTACPITDCLTASRLDALNCWEWVAEYFSFDLTASPKDSSARAMEFHRVISQPQSFAHGFSDPAKCLECLPASHSNDPSRPVDDQGQYTEVPAVRSTPYSRTPSTYLAAHPQTRSKVALLL